VNAVARYVVLAGVASVCIGVAEASQGRIDGLAVLCDDNLLRVQDNTARQSPRRPPVLNTLHDIGLALSICWAAHLPPQAQARPGMNVTVMLTFTRSGEVLGEPRFTYMTPEASPETRALYQRAAVEAINSCTPLPLSDGLGGAIAGRPTIFPFVDRRNEKGA
jgi:hypothetical protein